MQCIHPYIQPDGNCGPPGVVGDQAHVLAVDVPAGHVELVGQLLVQATPPGRPHKLTNPLGLPDVVEDPAAEQDVGVGEQVRLLFFFFSHY